MIKKNTIVKINRWKIRIGLVVILACLGASNFAAEKKKQEKPNFLFILIDDLGWKDLGCMGSKYYETPNIDKLATEGVSFTNAYAPAANCAPSRACILSGQNTPRHGIYTVGSSERGDSRSRKLIPVENKTTLTDANLTFAEVLKGEGYRTGSIGKWHVGNDPRTQGFDVNIAGSHAGHPKSYFSPYKNKNLIDGPEGEYLTDRLTCEAIQFLKESKDQPFCLYLPYFTVHTPIQGKKELIEKYKAKGGEKGQNNAAYAAMVESVDQNIGKLMQSLDDLGLAENTMLVFFSDNGGIAKISSQRPLRAGKGSYYEGGIREPMIIRWPKKIKGEQECDVPVSGLDFYPTFLEAAGVSLPKGKILDGESLIPMLTEGKSLQREALYWHFPIYLQAIHPILDEARDPLFRTRPGSVIRVGDWKLHEYFEDGGIELYNLKEDLGEKENLVKKFPKKAKKLLRMLTKWRQKMNAPIPEEPNPQYDRDFEIQLIEKKLKVAAVQASKK
ncbi:MAG: aryl-sulfate sulfohydrolase [Bacteroidales bacterium]|nr:MAG: aryl-sulfate sulfohydrolase [Bacteroidales bacterium]